ncbi:hypothetical protein B0H16DRAFT_1688922 [Mycena metata]|uniref:Novel STAND NTPase 1 domain-containing protein n=1 Tax=Mycena metata TaxID=1033252 RepID=A0AAD7NGN7_9AGAR|nr:hypothetical protein B0H16DRAFT_1688922 [Mycena metata]
MPRQQTITEVRLDNISKCATITVSTLDVLVKTLKIQGLEAMVNTTQSLLKMVQTIKQDKNECAELMEQTHGILNAIIGVYVKSDTGIELPPNTLNEIANFTQTLNKIHTFIEAQQSSSKVKKFFRQGELNELLKDCKMKLQDGLKFFQIQSLSIVSTARDMEEQAQIRQQEVLNIIETLSSSDSASTISRMYSGSYARWSQTTLILGVNAHGHHSSNSISLLPAEPKIFHGRESELADILNHFKESTPRIAILGAGGMGKTSLAQTVLHHQDIMIKYQGNQLFVVCDTAASKVELAGLIGVHLGMKPGKDLTQAVLHRLAEGPSTLLILDNLETAWEPAESRKEVEEFLSLLTDIASLALMSKITMRGVERPSKVQWSRPFLHPLEPLAQEAARKMFIDIADDRHSMAKIDQILQFTDNMPLSISLLAHAVDAEGCTAVLLRWQQEHTSVISEGYDRGSNLEISISLSLASPRITATPHSQELLSLLAILPDGLSDAELKQSNFLIQDILDCKRALLRTALAYTDDRKRLKSLVPIREYMAKFLPPTDKMIIPLLKHFHGLLQVYDLHWGNQSSTPHVDRLRLNYNNIPNIIENGLHPGHPNLADSISCASHFIRFSANISKNAKPLMDKVLPLLPYSDNHWAKAWFIVRLFGGQGSWLIPHPDKLIAQTFEWLETFHDPDLEATFYNHLSYYYSDRDIPSALKYNQMGLLLAKSHGNIEAQSLALVHLSWIKWFAGDYITSQINAQEAQSLTKKSGNLHGEARAIYIEALCCQSLGHFGECIFLVKRASALLELCGLSQGETGQGLINCQAEVHAFKSEYDDACTLQRQLLLAYQEGRPYFKALSLINIAQVEIPMGVSYDTIQEEIDASQVIFREIGDERALINCDMIQADLNLREGDMSCSLFCKTLKFGWGQFSEIVTHCLECLADVTRWGSSHDPSWSIVLLAHSLKAKEKLGIHKALQFIGDVYLMENEEATAVSLFTTALEGFTYMDVHYSRAECMIRLGDIAKKNSDGLKALELWETARALFERSSQAKRVQDIDERVGGISEEVKEQHQKNLAQLAKLNVPAGNVENVDSDAKEPGLQKEQAELIVA